MQPADRQGGFRLPGGTSSRRHAFGDRPHHMGGRDRTEVFKAVQAQSRNLTVVKIIWAI